MNDTIGMDSISKITVLEQRLLEQRIKRLETALTAVVGALAYGQTTHPYPFFVAVHQHALCGSVTAQRLGVAVEALGIDVGLGMDEDEG